MNRFLLPLLIFIILFVSCSGSKHGEIEDSDFPSKKDTVELVFQYFQNNTLISKWDTQTVYINKKGNKTIVSHTFPSSNDAISTVIILDSTGYFIEKLPASNSTYCTVNKTSSDFPILGEILIGSCGKPNGNSLGGVLPDSSYGIIYSVLYGSIATKGFQIQSGEVVYSVNGDVISEDQRLVLISKM